MASFWKKPFGGKKSVFNQVARVTGIGTVAALTAQTLSLKTLASSINKNSGLLKESQLDTAGGIGQKVGLAVAGGALLGSLSPAQPAANLGAYNTPSNYVLASSRNAAAQPSFLAKAWQGLKAVANYGMDTMTKAAAVKALLPAGSPPPSATPSISPEAMPWISVLPGMGDYKENLPDSLVSANNGDTGGGGIPGGDSLPQTAGGGILIPAVLLGIIGLVLFKGVPKLD